MTEFLVKAVGLFLNELSKEQEHVFADFLLLRSSYHGADGPWPVPQHGGKLDKIDFQGQAWPVVWCDSELNLRREILHSSNGKAVLLFPSDQEDTAVPPDIRARAHHGYMQNLKLWHLLEAETGSQWPPDVDYDEWRPAILRHHSALVKVASQQLFNVSRDQLEALLVQAAFGLTIEGANAALLIVQLYLQPPVQTPLPRELELFQGQLALHNLPAREVVRWVAERPDRAKDFLVAGAMMRIEYQLGLVPNWGAIQSLQGHLFNDYSQSDSQLMVLDLAWECWQQLPGNERRRQMKRVEERLGTYIDLDQYTDLSPRSLRYRISKIAESLAEGHRETKVIGQMREHLFAGDEKLTLDTLQQMDSLLGWGEAIIAATSNQWSAVQWALWYRREGAFADLAALRLKINAAKKLNQPVEAVLECHWDTRNPVNEAFAQALLDKYEATLYHEGIIGTHKILGRLVLPLIQKDQRVLLVVLDGLSYPGLIHLVEQLHKEGSDSIGVTNEFTGLAILPSVTAASRKAIFMGERPTDTLDSDEIYAEKAKTNERTALEKACKPYKVVLHNQTSLSAEGGQMRLFEDLSNPSNHLVALILNQVDEGLKGGREPELYDPTELGVFNEALNDGLSNGRAGRG